MSDKLRNFAQNCERKGTQAARENTTNGSLWMVQVLSIQTEPSEVCALVNENRVSAPTAFASA
jgi:hypothetical protein